MNFPKRALAWPVTVALLLAACGGAQSSPTSPRSVAASPASAAAAKPASAAASAAKPTSAIASASAKPAASAAVAASAVPVTKVSAPADGQAQLDSAVAAAKQEGKVVVFGPPGDSYRNAVVDNFAKAYPDIKIDWTGGLGGGALTPRIRNERSANQYLEDVYITGSSNAYDLIPANAVAPLMPYLLSPDVLDDSKWFDGFNAGFNDLGRKFAFGFEGSLSFSVYVNRDVVPESALSSIDQLTDPQWRGKFSWQDPTIASAGATVAGQLLLVQGEDWLRKGFSQGVVSTKDSRQQVDWLVRGQYPISMGVSSAMLRTFKQQGVGKNVVPLAPKSPAGARISSGFGTLMVLDRAPHPSATKVFVNWLFGKDEQSQWIRASGTNSRRLDVDGPAESALNPDVNRKSVNDEAYFQSELKARGIAKELIK